MTMNMEVNNEAILMALNELEKWQRIKDNLDKELTNACEQVKYYTALVKEMKQKVSPGSLPLPSIL